MKVFQSKSNKRVDSAWLLGFIASISALAVSIPFFPIESNAEEYYSRSITSSCIFSYQDEVQNEVSSDLCYVFPITILGDIFGYNIPVTANEDTILNPVESSINMIPHDPSKVLESEVSSSSIPSERYDNVGEPTFGSNGDQVFFAGNHYAARAMISNGEWQYVDPYFDFRGFELIINATMSNATIPTGEKIPIFKADQHIEYDPVHDMYIWIRQGEPLLYGGFLANVDRLAISRDTITWRVYDLISTDVLPPEAYIPSAIFDYPDTILTDSYLYLTTSVFDNLLDTEYGLIMRFPLDALSNSLDEPSDSSQQINYDIILDREVEGIAPVDGSSDPVYFGAHLPSDNSMMRIYQWDEILDSFIFTDLSIEPWNSINNEEICSSMVETWWCKANTSSRIRSAWMFQDSINFLWNSLHSYDEGITWIPYVDSATFNLDQDMQYERKYYLADDAHAWMFASVSPNNEGELGVITFTYDATDPDQHVQPLLDLAFGRFDTLDNKWQMMPIVESSEPIPVINEEGDLDYNFGDFLTLKAHEGEDKEFLWDGAGYIITGDHYYDVNSFFFMIK